MRTFTETVHFPSPTSYTGLAMRAKMIFICGKINQVPPWNVIMDQTETPHRSSSVAVSQKNIDLFTSTTIYTWTPDETNAGWFIIVVIALFAFIIISSMVVNQLHGEPEGDGEFFEDFFFNRSGKKKKKKLSKSKPIIYVNPTFSETDKSSRDDRHHEEHEDKPKRMPMDTKDLASGPTSEPDQPSEAVICIETVPDE